MFLGAHPSLHSLSSPAVRAQVWVGLCLRLGLGVLVLLVVLVVLCAVLASGLADAGPYHYPHQPLHAPLLRGAAHPACWALPTFGWLLLLLLEVKPPLQPLRVVVSGLVPTQHTRVQHLRRISQGPGPAILRRGSSSCGLF